MDTKKTNLTPELKEIYDRVMNTSGGKAAATTGTTPPLPTSATPTAGMGIPPTPPTPPMGVPNPSPIPPSPIPAPPPLGAVPPVPPIVGPVSTMPPLGSPAEDALSSTPARPVSEGNTFSFSGTAHQPPATPTVPGATPAAGVAKKKTKISLPVLIVLGLVFIVVWGLFWAIIFGFIKR